MLPVVSICVIMGAIGKMNILFAHLWANSHCEGDIRDVI
jgi:hypothetical protein